MPEAKPSGHDNWQRYLCDYRIDGSEWSVEVVATSFEDASRRLRAIGTTGQVAGPIAMKIAARTFSRVLAIAIGLALAMIFYWTVHQWGIV